MKKKVAMGLVLAMALMPSVANAEGSATINFKSKDNVEVGENVKVYLSIEDIVNNNNGIVSVGGQIDYAANLKLVEAKKLDTPYTFWFNPESNMLAGLDFTFEQELNKNTNIYEFTFTALNEGPAKITLLDAELGDKKAELLTPNVYSKTINVIEKDNNKNSVETLEKKIDTLEKTIETLKKENKKYTAPVAKTNHQESNKETVVKLSNKVKSFIKALKNLF